MSDWARISREVVTRVLRETAGQPEAVVRKALFDAYPFGERKFWPYKAWLQAIADLGGPTRRRCTVHDDCRENPEIGRECIRANPPATRRRYDPRPQRPGRSPAELELRLRELREAARLDPAKPRKNRPAKK